MDRKDGLGLKVPPPSFTIQDVENHVGKHDDAMTWKGFPHYWHLVRGIYRSVVDFPHNGASKARLCFLCCVPAGT